MIDVRIVGWNSGFLKVSFTALLREYAGLSLSQAHRATMDVTEGRLVVVGCKDAACANEFANQASQIGAIVNIEQVE